MSYSSLPGRTRMGLVRVIVLSFDSPESFSLFPIEGQSGPVSFAENPIARDCSSNASLNDRALTSHGKRRHRQRDQIVDRYRQLICKIPIRPRSSVIAYRFCDIAYFHARRNFVFVFESNNMIKSRDSKMS